MLESNLVILRNRFPEVLKRILSCPNQEPIHFKYHGNQLHTFRDKSFSTYGNKIGKIC